MTSISRFARLSAISTLTILSASIFAGAAPAQQYPPSMFQEMRWRNVGPFRGGRTRALAGVPSQPNVFYIGGVDSGVWKSDDFGETWEPIFDGQPTGSIGAIAVSLSDPNIIYVGCGEGLPRPDLSIGDGMYKSTDGGKTWTHLGLRDAEQIPALAIDPKDPNKVFAAVLGHPFGPNPERGIYRSTDGGATWQKILGKDDNTGGSDVEIDPTNPQVVYAGLWATRQGPWEDGNTYNAPGGLFKSTDGGNTWKQLTNGLPDPVQQVDVTISPSNPNRLFATVAAYKGGVTIMRSDDAGETWTRATTDTRPAGRIGGGDLPVPRVDPKDPDVLYVTSTVTWRTMDAGKTWTGIRGAPGGDDYQNIWINPNIPNIILLVCDQGALVSSNRGRTWSSWYNQSTAQVYHVVADNGFPYRVCGGQQDSGSLCISSRGNDGEITFRDWHPVGTIEYGYSVPDPLNPNIIYGSGRTDVTRYDWITGQVQKITPIISQGTKYRAERTQPLIFSPVDKHSLYYAANTLFKTTDAGHSWQEISGDLTREKPGLPASVGDMAKDTPGSDTHRGAIYSIAPSFHDLNTIWVGTDDGNIQITRDGGKTWKNITPPELAPWSKVTQLVASHFDEMTAYASVSRFRVDDIHPYIYRTHDGGKTWKLVVDGIADGAAADTVREDSVRKGLLFAGTENAVWVSFNDGDLWQSLQLNLPHTSNRDLWLHDSDLIVATHGRGFWILDDITPLRQLTVENEKAAAVLFKPEAAYRVRRDTNTDTPLPPETPAGTNPPDGAIVDYYLAQASSGPVTLEIFDSAGKSVRRYSSTDKPEFDVNELERTLGVPTYWVRPPQVLSPEAGMHRWVWDIHYDQLTGGGGRGGGYPISAVPHDTPREPKGPRANAGTYTVKLTVDGKTYSQPLTIKLDPRVKALPADVALETAAELRISGAMKRSAETVASVRALQTDLKSLSSQASGPAAESIAALNKKLVAIAGELPAAGGGRGGRGGGGGGGGGGRGGAAPAGESNLTQISGEFGAVYGLIDSADAAPTAPQNTQLQKLDESQAKLLAQWTQIKTKDVPALNDQLKKANLPPLEIKTPSPADN
ncbi:MAG TPA: hypothetical protein VN774_04485 [Candidatus Limnocylindrales bacterium]|nr:hypothetical protein [Candidatus Limnocylindrales bacterium]